MQLQDLNETALPSDIKDAIERKSEIFHAFGKNMDHADKKNVLSQVSSDSSGGGGKQDKQDFFAPFFGSS